MAVSLRVRAIAERERRRRQRTKQDEGIQFPAPQPGAQELFLNTTAEIAVYGGAAGGGKAGRCPDRTVPSYNEEMETKVLTPKGFKLIGDIRVNDQVCNPDGTVSRVIGVFDRGLQQFYRVTLQDGSSVEASEDHLWGYSLSGCRKRRKKAVPFVPEGLRAEDEWNLRYMQRASICTTKDLKKMVDSAMESKESGDRPKHVLLPLTNPVNLTGAKGRWAKMPPYTLGVLIGDGCLNEKGGVTISGEDDGIFKRVAEELAIHCPHLKLTYQAAKDGSCPVVRVAGEVGKDGKHNGVDSPQTLLRRDGLMGKKSWEKFIPEWIKLSPAIVRFEFIKGLMDTDGTIDSRGHASFCTVSEQLAKDTQWVLRSLGYRATLSTKTPTYTHKGEKRTGRLAYNLYIQGQNTEMLFSLERKRQKVTKFNGGDVWAAHQVISVEKTVVDYARCIQVDNPNHLYLTDDFIVTHNTFALLMDTAKEELIEHPAYNAVIFRRSYPQIMNPGGLWDESATMYPLINGSPKQSAVEWSFPSGAKIAFRHLGHETTKYQWQGSQFPTLCFDELTHFSESQFWYMVSRNRSPAGIPTKIRATTNPDADSWVADFIDWWIGDDGFPIPERGGVVRWFVRDGGDTIWADDPDDLLAQYPTQQPKSFTFIPANIQDNPILLEKDPTYLGNLQAQHPVERARLLEGNWKARFDSGTVFDRTWFTVIDPVYAKIGRVVRFWDIAATAAEMARSTTYYTAGVKMTKYGDIYTVLDVTARQVGAGNVEAYIMAIAQQDGKDVKIRWEREGGSSGILWGEQLKKRLQALGYDADYISPLGDKVTRATPYATDASNGKVFVTRKDWTDEYLGCLQRFDGSPQPLVNDYTDASSGAHQYLDSSGILVAPSIKEATNSNRRLKAVWD